MTLVQALLSVDAGQTPKDAVVFVAVDPEAPVRRARAVAALTAAGLAVVSGLAGGGRTIVALLGLMAGILAVIATPTEEPDTQPAKKPTLVVTATGIIVRDPWGLRSWQFAELSAVLPHMHESRLGLLLVKKDGGRDFIEHLSFQRGERLRDIIGRRLSPNTSTR